MVKTRATKNVSATLNHKKRNKVWIKTRCANEISSQQQCQWWWWWDTVYTYIHSLANSGNEGVEKFHHRSNNARVESRRDDSDTGTEWLKTIIKSQVYSAANANAAATSAQLVFCICRRPRVGWHYWQGEAACLHEAWTQPTDTWQPGRRFVGNFPIFLQQYADFCERLFEIVGIFP